MFLVIVCVVFLEFWIRFVAKVNLEDIAQYVTMDNSFTEMSGFKKGVGLSHD